MLLSLYRFRVEARDDLFRVLERLGDRLWIPYQVGLEFHRNRLSVIAAQENYFSTTRNELTTAVNTYVEKLRSFSGRIAFQEHGQRLEGAIRHAHGMVIDKIRKAKRITRYLKGHDSDSILARLEKLLANRTGNSMEPSELDSARKEALRRVAEKIPPGYMDKPKGDPTGDYLLWVQLKQEASRRKLPTVLITDDRKEDWYRREHGMTLGARRELREEMQAEAGVAFLAMTTETFLIKAKNYLDVTVNPDTVAQAKDLSAQHPTGPAEPANVVMFSGARSHVGDQSPMKRQLLLHGLDETRLQLEDIYRNAREIDAEIKLHEQMLDMDSVYMERLKPEAALTKRLQAESEIRALYDRQAMVVRIRDQAEAEIAAAMQIHLRGSKASES